MKLHGRVLHLAADPKAIAEQLQGVDLGAPPQSYHYGVNTDAIISGRACTLGYTPAVLGPHLLENFLDVVGENSVADGKFQVLVGGAAYGSGSSREVAVVAHAGAGIQLIVAESFQRIFQENMVYSGMPFTTDLNVLRRLEAGEDVELKELAQELPPFFRQVALDGGLLPHARALIAGERTPTYDVSPPSRPMNIAEKIIATHTWVGAGCPDGVAGVHPGDQVLARVGLRGLHEYTTGMVMALYAEAFGDIPVTRPNQVAVFEDHFVLLSHPAVPSGVKEARLAPAQRLTAEMQDACERFGLRYHGPGSALGAGVCHRVVLEQYALPGELICLTDSHSPTAGVLNTFAFGVGSTAMAFALRTGLMPVTVPKVVRVNLTGQPHEALSPKDVILHIIGDPYFREEQWRDTPTDTCIIEFGGPALHHWTVDELSVLTNMTVEGGLMTGVVEPCPPIVEFVKSQRGVDVTSRLVYPDPDATYQKTLDVALSDVPLTLATPGDSRNRAPLADYASQDIHNVVIASCTGGSLSDLQAAANVLRDRSIAPGVRVTITPASEAIEAAAEAEGLLSLFRDLGCTVSPPGCGSCIGNGPGVPEPGEVTVSTTNRNFSRRMGAAGPVFLVSPAVAAASAVTGRLTDPRSLDN